MIRFILLPLFLLLNLSCEAQTGKGSDSINAILTNSQSLLKDRLFIQCPAGAMNVPRPHDIMSNPPSPEQETRITCDKGTDRLVMYAQEMNSFSTRNLLEAVISLYNPDERTAYTFSKIKTSDGMKAILTTPLKQDSAQDAILINSILIQTSDSTLIQVGAYINPRAFVHKKQYQMLAEAMFQSIKAGPRKLRFKARKEVQPMSGGVSSLVFDCPENYILLPDIGFDFNTYQLRKLEPLTRHVSGGLIVYTGLHPSQLALSYGFQPETRKTATSFFLGKEMEWDVYADKTKNIFIRELICDAGETGSGLKIHIAILASSETEMKLLMKIAGKIAIKPL
jgi:hypothetical protein